MGGWPQAKRVARSGLTTEQLIYRGRAEGWLAVASLEADHLAPS